MPLELSFEIPIGFILKSDTIKTDYDTAERIMKSKRKRRFTCAKKEDGYIYLEKHYYVCPKCGNRIPAYSDYIDKSSRAHKLPSKNEIEDFCSYQLSFFEDQTTQMLSINKPSYDTDIVQCQYCFHTCRVLSSTRNCTISQDGSILQLACENIKRKELFALRWIADFEISTSSLSIEEILQFDFSNGKVDIFLYDGNNLILSKTILNPNIFSDDDPCLSISKNIKIRRGIRRAYEMATSHKCPFSDVDISLSKIFMLTNFVGYDQAFYDAIPFVINSSSDTEYVEASFEEISKKLQNSTKFQEVYNESSLPKCKSIKRVFYQKPQFFFYKKELEVLWELIHEPMLFCKLIYNNNIFDFLAFIHESDKVIEYFSMLKEVRGVAWLYKMLEYGFMDYYHLFEFDAMEYYVMSEQRKEKEKKKYKSYNIKTWPSKPKRLAKQIAIDGYLFSRLNSESDYMQVGKALSNRRHPILAWKGIGIYPAFSVQKEGEYVAGIEMDDRMCRIIKVFGWDESAISPESEIGKAIEKWRVRFNLELDLNSNF